MLKLADIETGSRSLVAPRISAYVLTFNSQRRLADVLAKLKLVADEIIVLDSGSTDQTAAICAEAGIRLNYNKFENFSTQRGRAIELCREPWVLEVDSDEVLSDELVSWLLEFKRATRPELTEHDGFAIRREWIVMGRKVHCFYPVTCPDEPLRLYQRALVSYGEETRRVHEYPAGLKRIGLISDPIYHFTCDSVSDMYSKVNQYTNLLAQDLLERDGRPSWFRVLVYPFIAWFVWYVIKGGWRDGWIGWVHGQYVRDTVYQKYLKARIDKSGHSDNRDSYR